MLNSAQIKLLFPERFIVLPLRLNASIPEPIFTIKERGKQ
jgi:hypothetical protein